MQTKTVEESPWKKTEVSTPQNEYAKKITMAFAEYLADNNYEVDVRHGRAIFNEIDDPEIHGEDGPELLTTHQVFLKFADANPGLFIAALRSQPTGWLPISTAPKDGTKIILFHEGYGSSLPIGSYQWISDDDESGWWCWATEDKNWWEEGVLWPDLGYIEPTHWMPLPSAPGSEPLPGELPGVEECFEKYQKMLAMWNPLNENDSKSFITFCQTPKQGKKD